MQKLYMTSLDSMTLLSFRPWYILGLIISATLLQINYNIPVAALFSNNIHLTITSNYIVS